MLWFNFWNKNSAFLISRCECPWVSLPLPCELSRDRVAQNTRNLSCTDQSGGKATAKLLGKAAAPAQSPAPTSACKRLAQLEICVHKCTRGNTTL